MNASAPAQSSAPASNTTASNTSGPQAQEAAKAGNPGNPGNPANQAPSTSEGQKPQEAQKPADPVEAELVSKFGEKFTALDPEIRAQVVAAVKKDREADRRFQQVAKLQKDHDLTQKQASMLLDGLINDPASVFTNPEIMKRLNRGKLREFAERIVWEEIQKERMDPKDREIAELRAYREEREAREKEARENWEKQQRESQMKQATDQRRQYWEREIITALKTEGVEADGAFVAQVARYIQACKRAQKPVELPRIIKQVQNDFQTWQNRYLMAGFKPRQEGESNEAFAQRYEQWVSRLDPKLVEAIRTGDLAKLKNKNMGRPAGSTKPTEPKKEPSKKISMSEWLATRDQRMGRA